MKSLFQPNFLALLILFCSVTTILSKTSQFRIQQIHRQIIKEENRSDLDEAVTTYWFDQRVDHFSRDPKTFKQLYYMSTEFYKPGGPIYLYNAGEGPNAPWTLGGHLAVLANKTNGLIISIEHRYYGHSVPVSDLSTENMRYLTTAQSLEDMAYFIRHVDIPAAKENRKWITVGGSYPANLAVWMRLKYPDLVFATYSSSAPVRAKNNFYEYDLAVGDGLPPACSESLRAAVEHIDNVIEKGDKKDIEELKAKFGLEIVRDNTDFVSAMTDAPSYLVQYGDLDGIQAKLCDLPAAQNVTEIVEALGKFQQFWMTKMDINATSYNGDDGNSINLGDNEKGSRQWFWQTCTEYGYWQTAPPAPLPRHRSRYINIKYYEDSCHQTFAPSPSGFHVPLHANVHKIDAKYHSEHIKVARVVFVNGELDPWRRLSVSAPDAPPRSSMPLQGVFVVQDGHHCTDLSGNSREDGKSVKEVRKGVEAYIMRWLGIKDGEKPKENGKRKRKPKKGKKGGNRMHYE